MKKQTYEDLSEINNIPIGRIGSPLRDFLPNPKELARNEKTVKITLTLSEKSVVLFRKMAQKYHSSYQRMIRRLIDSYAHQLQS